MSKVWKTLWLAPIAPGHAPRVVPFPLGLAKANQILIEIFLARQLPTPLPFPLWHLFWAPAAANSIMQRVQESFKII